MKTISILLLILIGLCPVAFATEYTEPFLDDNPYMTFSVNGFADRDGRVTTDIVRYYVNPEGNELAFTDELVFMDQVAKVDASEGLEIKVTTSSGSSKVEISGHTSQIKSQANIRVESLSSRGGWKYG